MHFKGIITVSFENHMKYINICVEGNSRGFSINGGGTYNNHCA
jgi:hypothetical protein